MVKTTLIGERSMTDVGVADASVQDKMMVNRLFSELQTIFPAWRSQITSIDELNRTKRAWLTALVESGIDSIEKIKLGLKLARRFDKPFWPSSGMFIGWCRQGLIEQLEIPDHYEIYQVLSQYQSGGGTRLGRYAYWCWRHLDAVRFKQSSAVESERYFKRVYQKMVTHALGGGFFAEQPAAIKAERKVELSDADRAFNLKQINKLKGALVDSDS